MKRIAEWFLGKLADFAIRKLMPFLDLYWDVTGFDDRKL